MGQEWLALPDLDRNDKDFITKLMWNCSARYENDDQDEVKMPAITKRKGEKVKTTDDTHTVVEIYEPYRPGPQALVSHTYETEDNPFSPFYCTGINEKHDHTGLPLHRSQQVR